MESKMSDNRRHSAGKGDSPRPVDYSKWSANWDRIFGKKKPKKDSPKKNSKKS
jgi:hypothetical protein